MARLSQGLARLNYADERMARGVWATPVVYLCNACGTWKRLDLKLGQLRQRVWARGELGLDTLIVRWFLKVRSTLSYDGVDFRGFVLRRQTRWCD